jgi:predicted dehydrogenase
MTKRVSRRDVLKGAGSLAATAAAVRWFPAPAVLADASPGRKLNVAAIGCGGRGLYASGLSPELNYVALAEPDEGNLARALKNLAAGAEQARVNGFDPARIKTFRDYRTMYDKIHKQIDLVLIATPDHQHACPSMMAIKLGKHVYCEKPLVHHIAEARALGEAARQAKVATQMGNQGSGTGGHQALAEWLAAGAIGKLLEVHAWHIFEDRFGGRMSKPAPAPVPKGFDWDAWLGPARQRPFSAVYRPWHGWCDFGTGSLGGWGPHMMDAVCFALKLGYPQRVELLDVGDASEDRFPRWSTIRYDFPQRGDLQPIGVFWHEGSKPNLDGTCKSADGKPAKTRPNHPAALAEIARLDGKLAKSLAGAGSIFVGEEGMICCGSHGGAPVLLPPSRRKEFTPPPKTLPRPVGGIMGDFLRACKTGGGPTFSGFATFAGPFLEMLLVGHLAMRAGLNKPVAWDGANMKCTNLPELNQYVQREYRKGWTL